MVELMPKFMQLRLEGPFAVVIHKKEDSYRIRAFTAVDKMHRFLINDQEVTYGPYDSFHFNLQNRGLKAYAKEPGIDPAFASFRKKTKWIHAPQLHFITLSLPCPLQIRQDSTTRVTFENESVALMPLNHIFVYEITDFQQIQIHCNELGVQTVMQDGVFRLQLGLSQDHANPHQHAITFYNEQLLSTFFEGLKADRGCRLKTIDVAAASSFFSTTLECKNGGIIVTPS